MGGDREGDRPLVGTIGLSEIPDWPDSDKTEVGWELHQEFWGRGLATEGGRAAVRYGFEVMGWPGS
jgi:RimJ/RimL family protein N-acetyltransferase